MSAGSEITAASAFVAGMVVGSTFAVLTMRVVLREIIRAVVRRPRGDHDDPDDPDERP